MLQNEQKVPRVTSISKLYSVIMELLIGLLLSVFIATSVNASVVTGYKTDGASFIANSGIWGGLTLFREGHTDFNVVLRDDAPISIDFSGLSWSGVQDEYFDILLWNLTGTNLTDLNLLWEKESINTASAPKDPGSLGLIFLARGFSSANVKEITHDSDFYNLWLDFPNEVGYGVIKMGFNWSDFNSPIDDFSLHIGINGTKLYDDDNDKDKDNDRIVILPNSGGVSHVPVPASIWFFGTGFLGLFAMSRRTIWQKN